jgi:hypothetical protein
LETYRRRLSENGIEQGRAEACFRELEDGLSAYTYLKNL